MTTNSERAARLTRALQAGIDGDLGTIEELCTADVKVWSPRVSTSSRDALLAMLKQVEPGFSDFELETFPLDVGGNFACVEWIVSMSHSGPLQSVEGTIIEATGVRITVMGVTVAEFTGERICALRQYWDEATLFDQVDSLDGQAGTSRQ